MVYCWMASHGISREREARLCQETLIRRLRAVWPGWVQAAGFLLGGQDVARWLLLGRPLDESVLTLAAALIMWRAPARAQERRNAKRQNGGDGL
jgi:hypothetical protein